MHKLLSPLILALASTAALAKLPPPSDEAKAKAAEAAAKTAHTAKVDAYLLCKSQDKVAAHVNRTKFVYTPPEAAPAAAAAPAPAAAPAVAAPAKKS